MDCEIDLNRRPPPTLQNLSREKIVDMALVAVNRIQTGLRNTWLGWPLQFLPHHTYSNFEPKVIIVEYGCYIANLNNELFPA